jgi:hypothetical protein
MPDIRGPAARRRPGFVDTPWWSGLPEQPRQEYFAQAVAALPARPIAPGPAHTTPA